MDVQKLWEGPSEDMNKTTQVLQLWKNQAHEEGL